MNWILFGFKGCGKTYFGKRAGLPFLDTDEEIERIEGRSVRQIVLAEGMEYFRKRERAIIRTLAVQKTVIAVGGGSVLESENLAHLKRLGHLIYLKCPKNLLKKRMLTPPLPLFLEGDSPEKAFEQHYEQRRPLYERIPSIHLDLEDKEEETIQNELETIIKSSSSLECWH